MQNKINLPGFTAEATMYGSNSSNWLQVRTFNSSRGDQKVLMQKPDIIGRLNCYADCGSSDPLCFDKCDLDNGGGSGGDSGSGDGGGGGSQPSCRASCGPCIRSKGSLTNGFRICINANCKPRSVACHI